LTFGLGIIILQGVSRRKSMAGVNIMGAVPKGCWYRSPLPHIDILTQFLFLIILYNM
jgi:hypothetical protein